MQISGKGVLQAERIATAITLRWDHFGVSKKHCEGKCGESTVNEQKN